VEVIGLARYPSDPDKWWAPDGSGPTDFKIARLRFLYCPKQRVTFENLSLAPDRKTEVKITDVTKTGDVAVVSGRLGRRRR